MPTRVHYHTQRPQGKWERSAGEQAVGERYLMGLDFGGGGVRALLVDVASGRSLASFRAWESAEGPYTARAAPDADLVLVWEELGRAAADALERTGARPEQIAGVAATAMRLGAVVIDESGAPLYAGTNRDARGAAFGFSLAAESGEALRERMGRWPLPNCAPARLRWLAESDAGAFARAHAFFSLNDWVAHRLCGEVATDPSQAGESWLYDVARREWAWDWIDRLELPRHLFPAVRPAGSRLGALGEDAARALGLAPGTPVAVGGGDTQCGLLAVGAVAPGALGAIAGTTAPVEIVLERPVVDAVGRLWTGQHVIAERWLLESNAGTVGESLDWLAGVLHPDAPAPVAALLDEAAAADPGAGGLHSTFGAQLWDGRAIVQPLGSLTLSHVGTARGTAARGQLARAVAEGVAYGIRANLDQLREVSGLAPDELRLGGGLSRSAGFGALLADVLGLPVALSGTPASSALGAAICAGVAAGIFPDLAAGARALGAPSRRCEPDPARAAEYGDRYASWQRLRAAQAEAEAIARELSARALLARMSGAADV